MRRILLALLIAIACLLCLMSLFNAVTLDSSQSRRTQQDISVLDSLWQENATHVHGCPSYTAVLPLSVERETTLALDSIHSLNVYLDDTLALSYSEPSNMHRLVRHLISVPAGTSRITLAFPDMHSDTAFLSRETAYLGQTEAIFLYILKSNGYAAFFSLLSLCTSLILLGCALLAKTQLSSRISRNILDLSLSTLSAGIWILSDSQLPLLFSDNSSVSIFCSLLSYSLIPVFLLRAIQCLPGRRYRSLDVMTVLFLVNLVIVMLFYIMPAFSPIDIVFISHILIIVSIVLLVRMCIIEMRRYESRISMDIIWGVGLLLIFSAAALITFYVYTHVYAILYCIGLYAFMFCLAIATTRQLYEQMKVNMELTTYKKLALTDSMTRLGNRTAFMGQHTQSASCPDLAYVMLDINDLKLTNDQNGHHEGDCLIIDCARCIRNAFEGLGSCYRIGGDEFIVLMPSATQFTIESCLNRLEHEIDQANRSRSRPLSISYGYALRKDMHTTPDELMRQADIHMYESKLRHKQEQQNVPRSPKP